MAATGGRAAQVAIPRRDRRSRAWLAVARRIAFPHHSALFALADQAIVSLTNLLTLVIIGRFCPKEQLGLYALAFVVLMGATEVQSSLISTPYTMHRPRLSGEEAREYLGATLLSQLGLSLLAMAVLTGGAALLGSFEWLRDTAQVMRVLGLTVAFMLLKDHVRRVCFAVLKMRSAAGLDFCVALLQVSSLLLLGNLGLLSATAALMVMAASSALAAFGWLLLNRDQYLVVRAGALEKVRVMWRQGRWMTASGLLSLLAGQLYPWFLTALHGAAATALWAACWSLTSLVNPLLLALSNYLGPAAAKTYAAGGARRLWSMLLGTSAVFTLAMALFCIAAVAVGAEIVAFVYGRSYGHDGLVVSLLALNVIPVGLSMISSRGLFALERADVDFWINLAPAGVALSAGLWLTYAYSVDGAALALLAGNTLSAATRCKWFASLSRAVWEGRTS